jgi:adenylosuccinate synthase
VGEGPLPTELTGEMGDRLRESGQEFGAVTGRPRRCGWFDAVAVRYASRINGLDALALTKLDVLDGLPELQVCTAYRCRGKVLTEMPGELSELAACEPVYETLPGWTEPTRGVREYSDLPREARAYVARLEEITGVPAAIVSTGSGREETIFREGTLAADLQIA